MIGVFNNKSTFTIKQITRLVSFEKEVIFS